MIVGYARTSTTDQKFGLDVQLDELRAVGCEKIFQEQVSSVAPRAQLEEAVRFVRDGDVLIVTKLDRLARSILDLWKLIQMLEEKRVALRVLAMSLDTGNATGRLMVSVLAAVAQFEREILIERQRDGIEKAKSAGVRFGRKPVAQKKLAEVVAFSKMGMAVPAIVKETGLSRASVYRLIKAAG